MVITIAPSSAFLSIVLLPSPASRNIPSSLKLNPTSSRKLQIKVHALEHPGVNGLRVGGDDGRKASDAMPASPSPASTSINPLQDWNMLLAAVETIFLATEKERMVVDPGKTLNDGRVFRQEFKIRSYEVGADRTASIQTLMNLCQDTAVNHARAAGLLATGFGTTEMCKRNLLWVVAKSQVMLDRYPQWSDVIHIDTWMVASGKNGLHRYWVLRDSNTGDIMMRASSVSVMMNRETRKISKMPDEVRQELSVLFLDSALVLEDDDRKLPKIDKSTMDYRCDGLTPQWHDLDLNQHVNNVKYVGWILESIPSSILETHELVSLILEYKRECKRDDVLQSLTSIAAADSCGIECQHLLCLEDGREIVKGRTQWRPKIANKLVV